jgi:hypothetical protein
LQIERERAKKRAIELGLDEVDRIKMRPVFNQDRGLIVGKGAVAKQQQAAAAAAADAAAAVDTAAAEEQKQ